MPAHAPTAPTAPPCVFCDPTKIASPFTVVHYNGRKFRVFEPLAPVAPGHLLVVPFEHAESAAHEPFLAGDAAAVAAMKAMHLPAANIITSIGAAATQTVKHLHVHVVPRAPGDGLPLPWTPQQEASGRH